RNPLHSFALQNKAACIINQGRLPEGLELLAQARAIEPNDPWNHRTAAIALRTLGRFEDAVAILGAALSRCPWDLDTWLVYMEDAAQFDLPDAAALGLESTAAWLDDEKELRKWRKRIASSRCRQAKYRELLGAAIGLQGKQRFSEALIACEEAAKSSKNN